MIDESIQKSEVCIKVELVVQCTVYTLYSVYTVQCIHCTVYTLCSVQLALQHPLDCREKFTTRILFGIFKYLNPLTLPPSQTVLKRSLSVSNSRLQRKISKKLLSKERNNSQSDETGAPNFLRRNRSSSSVDKSSPPPDLNLMTNAGSFQVFRTVTVFTS